ncbi:MAG: toll/interleukin-1 receptor domain-containing protein [Alphaproteobacteria bacterium]|nr:toll/interleukin-1 receptor domain-containing protein [Alphaproteobacteria bacterium]
MPGASIFVSHRAEYGSKARALKKAIIAASGGAIDVFISEEIPSGTDWRELLEKRLDACSDLIFLYGAPYEDWTWCLYEAGYFTGRRPGSEADGHLHCIVRPDIPPPGPLNHRQLITTPDVLCTTLEAIFAAAGIADARAALAAELNVINASLFDELEELHSYPRLYLTAKKESLTGVEGIPASARLAGSRWVLQELFGIQRHAITWAEIVALVPSVKDPIDRLFLQKWLRETSQIVLEARHGRINVPQTILIARNGGKRCRLLLYQARSQADDIFSCEFLVVNEVGGPSVGVSRDLLALLTAVRMAFRFRYEFVRRFKAQPLSTLPRDARRVVADEIHQAVANLMTESESRGHVTKEDFLDAFEEAERTRLDLILGYWTVLHAELNRALGYSPLSERIADDGLVGPNIQRFEYAARAMELLNTEFLRTCCNRLAKRMSAPSKAIAKARQELDQMVAALAPDPSADAA